MAICCIVLFLSPRRRPTWMVPASGTPSVCFSAPRVGLHPLQQEGDTLTATDASRTDGVLLVALAQHMHQVGSDARARGGQRVAQRNGAATGVQLGGVQLQLALARDRLRRERLVDLKMVDEAEWKQNTSVTVATANRAPKLWHTTTVIGGHMTTKIADLKGVREVKCMHTHTKKKRLVDSDWLIRMNRLQNRYKS